MRNRLTRVPALLLALLVIAACSSRRPAVPGVDANYTLEVTNPTAHAMAVSVDLGANQMGALGTVGPGETRSFEINNPSTNDIILVASDPSGQHTVRKSVELSRRRVARVSLD